MDTDKIHIDVSCNSAGTCRIGTSSYTVLSDTLSGQCSKRGGFLFRCICQRKDQLAFLEESHFGLITKTEIPDMNFEYWESPYSDY